MGPTSTENHPCPWLSKFTSAAFLSFLIKHIEIKQNLSFRTLQQCHPVPNFEYNVLELRFLCSCHAFNVLISKETVTNRRLKVFPSPKVGLLS